jgi:CIC family chloride channel protein
MELRRVLAACGAGAGLASIYNVPFGGACFAIEVVLGVSLLARAKVDAAAVIGSAVACSWGATVIARVVVPDRPTYTLDAPTWDAALMMCAAVAGPILGVIGHRFGALVDCARQRAARGTQMLWRMPVGYVLLGLMAIPFPLILGNGHAMAQNLFAAAVPIGTAVALAVAKPVATLVTILTGATGGRLTPSLATGAALALCFGTLAALALPIQPSSAAVVAAAAFLAGAMRAPLTAGILAIEFTGATSMSPAVAIAVGGAWAVLRVMGRGREEGG